jgi:hypothetical protein
VNPVKIVVLVAALIFSLSACGTGTPTPVGGGGFSIASVAPNPLNIQRGGAGNLGVTITRMGGFTEAITLQLDGPPTGIGAAQATIAAGSSQGTLIVWLRSSAVCPP